jgi:predicted N-acetyltransferase YhbS
VSAYQGPDLLTDANETAQFDCGDDALNDWLRRPAARNQKDGSSRTWVAIHKAEVVGYYASSTAAVTRAEATKRASRNQPDPIPAMLLGRLAVDSAHQGRGLGAALLKHFLLKSLEVSRLTGLRLVLVHAGDDSAASFYRHFGFESSPIVELTMMLPISDIRP